MDEEETKKEKMEVDSNSNISWSSEEEDDRFNNMEIEPIPFKVFHEDGADEFDKLINNIGDYEDTEYGLKWEETGIAKALKEFEKDLEDDLNALMSKEDREKLLQKD